MNAKSSLYAPQVQPVPPDVLFLAIACDTGRASHKAGFRASANVYAKGTLTPVDPMKAWAWDLGWREQETLARSAGR